MPAMPGEQVREGIIRGLYPVKTVKPDGAKLEVQLLGSGVILNEVLRAQQILAEKYGVASTVYSATSYQMLRKDAIECERHNRLHPDASRRRCLTSQQVLGKTKGPIVATQRLHAGAAGAGRAVPRAAACSRSGTDGFGRSETRKALRRFFEVDAEHVVVAALLRAGRARRARPRERGEGDQGPGPEPGRAAPVDGVNFRFVAPVSRPVKPRHEDRERNCAWTLHRSGDRCHKMKRKCKRNAVRRDQAVGGVLGAGVGGEPRGHAVLLAGADARRARQTEDAPRRTGEGRFRPPVRGEVGSGGRAAGRGAEPQYAAERRPRRCALRRDSRTGVGAKRTRASATARRRSTSRRRWPSSAS